MTEERDHGAVEEDGPAGGVCPAEPCADRPGPKRLPEIFYPSEEATELLLNARRLPKLKPWPSKDVAKEYRWKKTRKEPDLKARLLSQTDVDVFEALLGLGDNVTRVVQPKEKARCGFYEAIERKAHSSERSTRRTLDLLEAWGIGRRVQVRRRESYPNGRYCPTGGIFWVFLYADPFHLDRLFRSALGARTSPATAVAGHARTWPATAVTGPGGHSCGRPILRSRSETLVSPSSPSPFKGSSATLNPPRERAPETERAVRALPARGFTASPGPASPEIKRSAVPAGVSNAARTTEPRAKTIGREGQKSRGAGTHAPALGASERPRAELVRDARDVLTHCRATFGANGSPEQDLPGEELNAIVAELREGYTREQLFARVDRAWRSRGRAAGFDQIFGTAANGGAGRTENGVAPSRGGVQDASGGGGVSSGTHQGGPGVSRGASDQGAPGGGGGQGRGGSDSPPRKVRTPEQVATLLLGREALRALEALTPNEREDRRGNNDPEERDA